MHENPSHRNTCASVRALGAGRLTTGLLPFLVLCGCAANTPDSDPSAASPCRIDVMSELSSAVPTVGIVTFSTNLAALDSAAVEFGRDTSYGSVAPVELGDATHRTLLLGMTPSTAYHFRVVARAGSASCASADQTLTTGAIDNGVQLPKVVTHVPEAVAPGFLLASQFTGAGPSGGMHTMVGAGGEGGGPDVSIPGGDGGTGSGKMVAAGGAPGGMFSDPSADAGESLLYILNAQGEPVWWLTVPIGEVTRVLMSYDGKSLLALSLNVAGSPSGRAVKVSLDGLEVEPISVPNAHHDFTVTPDGGYVFIRKSEDDCDELMRLSSDGEWSLLFRVADAFGDALGSGIGGERCHTNSLHYNAIDASFTFSVLNMNSYVKLSATGELEWVLGGAASEFSGDGAEWSREHGHHWLDGNHLLFFNNGDLGSGDTGSLAVEVELDPVAGTAKRVWTYQSGLTSAVLGDVQRLPNGNTLVAYSASGVMHQVNAAGELVQELTWPLGGAFGYVNHRPSLYGAPALP